MGRKSRITSYDNPTVGSGSIVNQVQSVYDDFGQLVTEYQQHGGAVNAGTSLKVQYAYADGSSNTIRLTKMTYPDGRELNYDYGSAGSSDDALSRVASLIDDDGSTRLVDYSYLGAGAIIQADYVQPDVRCDLAHGAGADLYDGPMDRFGRVNDLLWYDYGSSAELLRFKHGYDRAGNRLYREEADTSDLDQLYSYDDVNRLVQSEEGTLSAGKDSISSLNSKQQWSLDPTGNWSGFKEDDDGDATWDLEQTRTSSAVNEITDVAETTGPSWITPAYNRAGNMTTIPRPADPTQSYAATYDAWNRLVKLEEGEDTVAEYVYDGAKRRVVKKTYDSGSLDETRHFYYTDPQKWQVIEERLDASGAISADADRQFVWGLRYIDDFVLRDRDTDSNGSLDERLCALQDANWNVTALVNASGNVQERYVYTAYGIPRILTSTFAARVSTNYDVEVRYGGYRVDGESNLSCVRDRMLNCRVGLWLQRDLVRYAGGMSLYGYLHGMPVQYVDPSGKGAFCDWLTDPCTGSLMACSGFLVSIADVLSNFIPMATLQAKIALSLFDCFNDLMGFLQERCYCHGVEIILSLDGSIMSCWGNFFFDFGNFPAALAAFFDALFTGMDELAAIVTPDNVPGWQACMDVFSNCGDIVGNVFGDIGGKVVLYPS